MRHNQSDRLYAAHAWERERNDPLGCRGQLEGPYRKNRPAEKPADAALVVRGRRARRFVRMARQSVVKIAVVVVRRGSMAARQTAVAAMRLVVRGVEMRMRQAADGDCQQVRRAGEHSDRASLTIPA